MEPGQYHSEPNTGLYLSQAREKGVKIVAVDPLYTDSAATFAQQWIPIRPGTDAAMLIAMAYVIITENLQDQGFIDKYTIGFDNYKDYVLGKDDGIAKTPQWAEAITTVPADVTVNLAREYATNKPAALIAGWGPARAAMGEQYARAANVLTAITGNIGIKGGYASGFMRATSRSFRQEQSRRPVESGRPPRKDSLYKLHDSLHNTTSGQVHNTKIFDAILRGRAGGYPADIKMAYVVTGNYINQHPNTRRGVEAFKSLEFVVVHEQFMTPTAKFGDIVLPVNTFMERADIAYPWLGSPYSIYLNKSIESLYETKSDLEIARELSKKLGIPQVLGNESEDELLRDIVARSDSIPDYEAFRRDGVQKFKPEEPIVGLRKQIEDPENNPFPTLSGKIEIYCEHIAEMNNPNIPPIPKYISPPENYDDSLAARYPLQLLTTHYKTRAHSTWHNVPWLREIEPHSVWINTIDAEARSIKKGDLVDVYNDRGRIRIPAQITERIAPGVVNVSQGAWYDPDAEGVDLGGCANVLTSEEHSPGGAWAMNTALVEVEPSPQG